MRKRRAESEALSLRQVDGAATVAVQGQEDLRGTLRRQHLEHLAVASHRRQVQRRPLLRRAPRLVAAHVEELAAAVGAATIGRGVERRPAAETGLILQRLRDLVLKEFKGFSMVFNGFLMVFNGFLMAF